MILNFVVVNKPLWEFDAGYRSSFKNMLISNQHLSDTYK